MDDNTTKVLLTAIVLAFVATVLHRFDRVSLHIERLKLDIGGLLKLGAGMVSVTLRGRPNHVQQTGFPDGTKQIARYMQGSFALNSGIRVVPGNHDIDVMFLTHPDQDHIEGLRHLLQCKHYPSRNKLN